MLNPKKRAPKTVKNAVAKMRSVETGNVALIAASFALPSEINPVRMRNEYSTDKTALFKVFEEHPAMGLGNGTVEQLRDDQHVEWIFQDILRNRIAYYRNPTNGLWSYDWMFGCTADSGAAFDHFSAKAIGTVTLRPSHALITEGTSVTAPHGAFQFAESDKDIAGFWIDSVAGPDQSTLTISLSEDPTATTGAFQLLRWDNGDWLPEGEPSLTVVAGRSYPFQILRSGYFAVQIQNITVDCELRVNHSGKCGCWGRYPAPYILNNAGNLEEVRTLGHSILVKNVTANINKQGAVCGVQPGKSRVWYSFADITGTATADCFAAVRDYAGAENTKPLETGIYGFVKPTEEEDLKFREPFVITNQSGSEVTNWTFATTPIVGTAYVVVAIQAKGGNEVDTGQNLLIRTDQSGEFGTSNQFYNVAKPNADPGDWRDGMEALASMDQFYENPIHINKILATVGKIARVGGRILSLFPQAAAVSLPLSIAGSIFEKEFQ